VAGVLAMVLSEQNLLDLSRGTDFYIIIPYHHTHTVSQTLSNRSGIGHYETYPDIEGDYATALDAVKKLWNIGLVYQPGMVYKYSTHAYTFAGASMEGATGKPIASIVNDYLAAPHNLSTLRVEDRGDANPNRSLLYKDGQEVTPDDLTWKVLGGGLESSAYDLARFGIMLLDGTILPPGALAAMWTPPDTLGGCGGMAQLSGEYALGWCTGTHSGTRAVLKTGVQNGARSFLLIYPDKGIVIAVLRNTRSGESDKVWPAAEIGKLMLAQVPTSASQYDQNRLAVTLTDPVEEPDDEGLDAADVVWPVSNPTVDPSPEDLEEPGDTIFEIFLPLIMR
ncbi:MAG TPA: serine hydrolase domain-containing protein, partial [Anaerolineae bacterium]|nr:serine hydrolase domain-containing protein [Anaerolineae bacterium]